MGSSILEALAEAEAKMNNLPLDEKKKENKQLPNNDEFEFLTLTEQKTKEEIRKIKIANEVSLRNLVEKKMVRAVISKYSELIQVHFVQLPRREAANITAMLSVEGREKEVENYLSEVIEKGLSACNKELKKIESNRMWE